MFKRKLLTFCTLFCALIFASAVQAHEYKLGDIEINHPFARTTVQGQSSGGAYLTIENKGKVGDELTKAESTIAKSVELHTMEMDGNVMRMRQIEGIDVPAGQAVALAPGG